MPLKQGRQKRKHSGEFLSFPPPLKIIRRKLSGLSMKYSS